MAIKDNDLDIISQGKGADNLDIIFSGVSHLQNNLWITLRGRISSFNDLGITLKGKAYDEQSVTIKSKNLNEINVVFKTPKDISFKRLRLFDTLNLRTTAVYKKPRDISNLKIVYGDFSNTKVPCTPLDQDGYIYHISDRPLQAILKVYVDGEPKTAGYRAYTAYQDETGHAIACVVFDNPQYDKRISVSCKGAMKLDTGELIENPADLIYDVFVNVQGYDSLTLDAHEISRFYTDCLFEEIKVACIINESKTIKAFLDELAINIHASWMISDGKSVMRLKWR